jgi:predicted nucleic acid-binding protein
MVRPLFDTNILIDHLHAVPAAREEIALYETRAISIVTWMEVMAGTDERTDVSTRKFLANFDLIPIDADIAELAVSIRKARRLKLPDAIIQATASVHGLLLVTRNEKDFPRGAPGVRMPYRIKT